MPVQLQNIRLDIDAEQAELLHQAAGRLGLPADEVLSARIVHRAVDARKLRPALVYTIDVELAPHVNEASAAEAAGGTVVAEPEDPLLELEPGDEPLPGRPVIVGAGPAGLCAGYLLAQFGFRPLILDRGRAVEERKRDVGRFFRTGELDPESNLLFGLGGAGTWSDGKLRWQRSDPLARFFLHLLVRCGADDDILVDAKPHVGTDILGTVMAGLAGLIEAAGGEFRFECRADHLALEGGRLTGVRCGSETIEAGAVLLGIGHSARDTVRALSDQVVAIEPRPFQVGVRIEHPQELIDRAQYGEYAGHPALPAPEYTLRHKARGGWRSVHSFCTCPGGMIVPATHRPGEVCTNGMSAKARSGAFSNTALVVAVGPDDFGGGRFDGMRFQERLERAAFAATGSFAAPAQRANDFLRDVSGPAPRRTSYPLDVVPVRLSEILPGAVYGSIVRALAMTFDRVIPGFAGEQGTVLAPESRVSSPVRLVRHEESRQSASTPGLYPIGEGSGYAGGIVSSALDGLRTARRIVRTYRPAE